MTPSTSEFKALNIQEVFVLALERELDDAIKDTLSRKVPSRFRELLTQMISFQNECKAFRESVRTTLKLIMSNLRETDTTLSDCYGFIAWKQLFAPAAESTELATAVALSHHTKVVSEMVWSVLSEEQQPMISTAPANATSRKAFTAPTTLSANEVKAYADQWESVPQPALLRDVTRLPAFHYPPLVEDDEEYDARPQECPCANVEECDTRLQEYMASLEEDDRTERKVCSCSNITSLRIDWHRDHRPRRRLSRARN